MHCIAIEQQQFPAPDAGVNRTRPVASDARGGTEELLHAYSSDHYSYHSIHSALVIIIALLVGLVSH